MPRRNKLTAKERIILVLSHKGCRNIEELKESTKLNENVLLKELSLLYKQGLIYRTWGRFAGKKFRKYCLKGAIKEELKLE
uniref:Plasmid regulatory protein n=1 Tax=Sulfolobus tengchongensis TaxID=207809 RepID=Q6H0Z1_9CREN|nr:plasmid regulatory protein [Sulfolobus tengchongensis]AAT46505.1 plasmid regulatory protein [Sulfolobus tengchongensis]